MFCSECQLPVNAPNLFQCLECNIITHQKCNMYTSDEIAKYNIIKCDMCRVGHGRSSCCICNQPFGLLKKCEYNHYSKWIHPKCLGNGKSYRIKEGYHITELCDKKDCCLCFKGDMIIEKKEDCDYDREDDRRVEMISTVIKCEVCFKEISIDQWDSHRDDRVKVDGIQCRSCLAWVHDKCEKSFYNRSYIEVKKSCTKCVMIPYFTSCVICLKKGGLMVQCAKSYAHVICVLSFPELTKRRRGNVRSYELVIPHASRKGNQRPCCLCDEEGLYMIQCVKCHIEFHPYCGFKANFDIRVNESNRIELYCNRKHMLYATNRKYSHDCVHEETEEHHSSSSSNKTTAISTYKIARIEDNDEEEDDEEECKDNVRINIKRKNNNERVKLKKQYTVLSDNLTIRIERSNYSKEIKTIKKFKRKKDKEKKEGRQKVKKKKDKDKKDKNSLVICNDIEMNKHHKFNWKSTDKYFKKMTKDKVLNTFPYAYLQQDDLMKYLEASFPNIPISNTKDILNENDYVICNIRKPQYSYYIVYKLDSTSIINAKPITSNASSSSLVNENLLDINFLSRKRRPSNDVETISSSTSSFPTLKPTTPQALTQATPLNININPQFIRGFRLNSLSFHMLIYERLSSESLQINEDYSYITKQILIKREMLRHVILSNIKLTQSLPSLKQQNSSINNYESLPNPLITEMSIAKNISTFKTMIKRLGEGLSDKHYESLSLCTSNNKPFNADEIQETIDHYYKESECSACLAYCRYSSTQIVYCDQCNVSVHLNCYGLMEFPYLGFKCDLCSSKIDRSVLKEIKCFFCLKSYGAMKKIPRGNWAHVPCILLSKYAAFMDYSTLNKAFWYKEAMVLSPKETSVICGKCKQNQGEKFECCRCKTRYHFMCAYFAGFKMKLIDRSKTTPNPSLIINDGHSNNFIEKNTTVCIMSCNKDYDIHWDKNDKRFQAKLRKMVYQKHSQ